MDKLFLLLTIFFLPFALTANRLAKQRRVDPALPCPHGIFHDITSTCRGIRVEEEYYICYFHHLGLINKDDEILVLRPNEMAEILKKRGVYDATAFELFEKRLDYCALSGWPVDFTKSIYWRFSSCMWAWKDTIKAALCPSSVPQPNPQQAQRN